MCCQDLRIEVFFFFVFFSLFLRGAMERPHFENGIYVTQNVDSRVL